MLKETQRADAEICTPWVRYCYNSGAHPSTSMRAISGEKTLQRQWLITLHDPGGGCCCRCHLEQAGELWSSPSLGKRQLHQDSFGQGSCALLPICCCSSGDNGSLPSAGCWWDSRTANTWLVRAWWLQLLTCPCYSGEYMTYTGCNYKVIII